MELYDVVTKLVGPTQPIGDTRGAEMTNDQPATPANESAATQAPEIRPDKPEGSGPPVVAADPRVTLSAEQINAWMSGKFSMPSQALADQAIAAIDLQAELSATQAAVREHADSIAEYKGLLSEARNNLAAAQAELEHWKWPCEGAEFEVAEGTWAGNRMDVVPAGYARRLAAQNRDLREQLAAKSDGIGLAERTAQLIAHRACCGTEHDPANGKLHGCCVVCGVPWPCEFAAAPAKSASPKQAAPAAWGVQNKWGGWHSIHGEKAMADISAEEPTDAHVVPLYMAAPSVTEAQITEIAERHFEAHESSWIGDFECAIREALALAGVRVK